MGDFQAISCESCGQQVMDLKFFADTTTVCSQCAKKSKRKKRAQSNFNRKEKLKEKRVHIDDPFATNHLKRFIISSLSNFSGILIFFIEWFPSTIISLQ
jgi:ribosome-binding protein aMBF1 (putative translation factor)